jgi:hypothetical protein
MGFDMEKNSIIPDIESEQKLEKEELERLKNEILEEAKKVVKDYVDNPSDISGSVVNIHQNSPALDTEKNSDEPLYSGSRWTKVLKSF